MSDNVEDFYGVYLLYCLNPRYKGRTYIGYTVDPNRRIKQHNRGARAGGAVRTSNRGPWEMILIVHGFPNDISALRFEWAWQNPHKSRRLHGLAKKKAKETRLDFCFRVMCAMLRFNPWARLPLTVRWLQQDFYRDFLPGMEPPCHMPVTRGTVIPHKINSSQEDSEEVYENLECILCHNVIVANDILRCLFPECSSYYHIICLANFMLGIGNSGHMLPVEGPCPQCKQNLLWGDLIRFKKGCYHWLCEGSTQAQSSS